MTASHISQRAQTRRVQLRLYMTKQEDQVELLIQMGTRLLLGIMALTSVHILLMGMLIILATTMTGEIDYQKSDSQPVGNLLFVTITVKQMIL